MEILNSREIAIVAWLSVFLAWGLSCARTRQSILWAVEAFLQKQVIVKLSLLFAYIGLTVWLLQIISLWNINQIKNTLIWSISVGLGALFRIVSTSDKPNFLRKWITDNLEIVVLVEFVATFYTFHIVIELVLIPFLALIGGMMAVAGRKEEYRLAARLLNGILSLFGAFLIAYAVYKIVVDFRGFATMETVQDFYIPPLLSLMLLPFLYILYIYISYENVFSRLEFSIEDGRLHTYAKKRSILEFGTDIEFLKRWARNIALLRPNDRESIQCSIREVKAIKKREEHPPAVSPTEGWSPYAAMKFLQDEGFVTGDYHRSFDEWFASSPYFEIGDGILTDNLAYYIEGDEFIAKRLKLVLNVNNPGDPTTSETKFYNTAKILINKAVGELAAKDIAISLSSDGNLVTTIGGKAIRQFREDWRGGIKGGYTKKLIIEHGTASPSL